MLNSKHNVSESAFVSVLRRKFGEAHAEAGPIDKANLSPLTNVYD
jgi:hypothetical protein